MIILFSCIGIPDKSVNNGYQVRFVVIRKHPKNEIPSGNYVELNDDLKGIVARYIKYQSCSDCLYELYFNKIDPHYSQVILYKGNKSLTVDEYEKNGRFPVIYTKVSDKKIGVYTGSEGYFKAPKNQRGDVKEKKAINPLMYG
ncbi:hypothetical protein HQN84_04630 [Pedobacter steynii]|uniref:hypothetical protein n=1 Tax=Pedobacter steynii TaxID=430522 RepID=UPI000944B01E|nr:hypothetical protein [Pedobacter steynii]NQX38118.1 hypothetical protein [Pedobacter steynii]